MDCLIYYTKAGLGRLIYLRKTSLHEGFGWQSYSQCGPKPGRNETLSRKSRISEGAGISVTHSAIGSEAVQ
jgi:hypothetical protein